MIERLFGYLSTPRLVCYRGFGSKRSFVFSGHLRSDFKGSKIVPGKKRVENVLYFLRTYLAKPYQAARIETEFEGRRHVTETDKYGYFEFCFEPKTDIDPDGDEWFDLLVFAPEYNIRQSVEVLVENGGNTFGVISDIDDTILISDAPHKLRLVINTLGGNSFSRKSFDGVSHWYHALVQGSDGVSTNPVFYVSSSHWNLYDFLAIFFKEQELPKGPLLLKDYLGIRNGISEMSDHSHKQKKIQLILDTYRETEFVLIGDSGQRDARLYTNIVKANPERIKAIYIRDVVDGADPLVEEAYMRLCKEVPLVVFQTTKEAVQDSHRRGLTV